MMSTTNKKSHVIIALLLIVGVVLHISAKNEGSLQEQDKKTLFLTGPSSLIIQKAIAGPCLGLGAEANLLAVFSVYWSIHKKELSKDDQQKAWLYLYHHLQRAQAFDPWYWDIYRLTSGLLVYQKNYQRQAIDILSRGAKARAWDWEVPFISGFLAHDLLNNDKLAFELMKMSINTPKAPPLAIGLATRFLSKTETVGDTLKFLRVLKGSLPKDYTQYIDKRIQKISKVNMK